MGVLWLRRGVGGSPGERDRGVDQEAEGGDAAGQGGYSSGAGRHDEGLDGPGEEVETGQPPGQDQEGSGHFDGACCGESGGGGFGEAVDGQQAGQEEQGSERGRGERGSAAPVAEIREEQQGAQRAQEDGDEAEEQGAYSVTELRQPVAAA